MSTNTQTLSSGLDYHCHTCFLSVISCPSSHSFSRVRSICSASKLIRQPAKAFPRLRSQLHTSARPRMSVVQPSPKARPRLSLSEVALNPKVSNNDHDTFPVTHGMKGKKRAAMSMGGPSMDLGFSGARFGVVAQADGLSPKKQARRIAVGPYPSGWSGGRRETHYFSNHGNPS